MSRLLLKSCIVLFVLRLNFSCVCLIMRYLFVLMLVFVGIVYVCVLLLFFMMMFEMLSVVLVGLISFI